VCNGVTTIDRFVLFKMESREEINRSCWSKRMVCKRKGRVGITNNCVSPDDESLAGNEDCNFGCLQHDETSGKSLTGYGW
jgi:hypothetical protein